MALACAYEAASPLDAAVLAGVLKQAGIDSRIFGQTLSGGIGELPAQGLVRVMVNTTQLQEAREIVCQWQRQVPDDDALEAAAIDGSNRVPDSIEEPGSAPTGRQWPEWVLPLLLMVTGALVARLLLGN
jgi:hypothetical protein